MLKIDSKALLDKLRGDQQSLDDEFGLRKLQVEASMESLEFSDTVLTNLLGRLQSADSPEDAQASIIEARKKILARSTGLAQSLTTLVSKWQAIESVIGDVERMVSEEEDVDRVVKRLENGEIDETRPRKVGDRPESIKNIRKAKKRIAEPTETD